MARGGFRGEVIARWVGAGHPRWDYDATERACLEVDRYLSELGENPAPCFHGAIARGDKVYIRRWVMGCHFDWLNPR